MISLDQGVVIAGRYTLVRPLAKGGMGSVWIARHRDLEIDVTVKFMAPSLVAEAEARMRFEREAKVAARLRSQHVVQVHDYGVEDETPYIIMELLKGESLSTRIEREGRLAPAVMARLLIQICKALRTAHEAGLVHRDLKPGNVFLALKDDDEVVKVLDFGIAKTGTLGEAQADTDSGVLLGSVHYMSPEQIRSSRTVDHRSDLWSVAVIIYRVLTGRLPFPGANLGDVLVRVCTDEAPPASLAAPDLPARIDRFFERALARDADKRFQSAPELAEAFAAMALEAAAPAPPQAALPASTPHVPAPAPPLIATAPAPFAQAPRPIAAAPADPLHMTMRMEPSAYKPAPPPAIPQLAISAPTTPWVPPAPPAATSPRTPPAPDPGPRPVQVIMPPMAALATGPREIPKAAEARAPGRPVWPGVVIAAAVVLVVILGLALRSRATAGVVEATTALPITTVEAAPSAPPTVAVAATDTATPSAAAPPATSAVAPRASASSPGDRAPPRAAVPSGTSPRIGPKSRPNPLDRSD
jgi:eukaryotic-like serine/threonine-protein kinase